MCSNIYMYMYVPLCDRMLGTCIASCDRRAHKAQYIISLALQEKMRLCCSIAVDLSFSQCYSQDAPSVPSNQQCSSDAHFSCLYLGQSHAFAFSRLYSFPVIVAVACRRGLTGHVSAEHSANSARASPLWHRGHSGLCSRERRAQ